MNGPPCELLFILLAFPPRERAVVRASERTVLFSNLLPNLLEEKKKLKQRSRGRCDTNCLKPRGGRRRSQSWPQRWTRWLVRPCCYGEFSPKHLQSEAECAWRAASWQQALLLELEGEPRKEWPAEARSRSASQTTRRSSSLDHDAGVQVARDEDMDR